MSSVETGGRYLTCLQLAPLFLQRESVVVSHLWTIVIDVTVYLDFCLQRNVDLTGIQFHPNVRIEEVNVERLEILVLRNTVQIFYRGR